MEAFETTARSGISFVGGRRATTTVQVFGFGGRHEFVMRYWPLTPPHSPTPKPQTTEDRPSKTPDTVPVLDICETPSSYFRCLGPAESKDPMHGASVVYG